MIPNFGFIWSEGAQAKKTTRNRKPSPEALVQRQEKLLGEGGGRVQVADVTPAGVEVLSA